MEKIYVNVLTEDVAKAKLLFDQSFNVVSDWKDIIQGLPVIILGWEFTKKLIPDASILDHVIDDGIHWVHFPSDNTKMFVSVVKEVLDYQRFLEVVNAK